MAEALENERGEQQISFDYFTGIDEEIFERLPLQDKRPYMLLGAAAFAILLMAGALVFFITALFTASVLIKIVAAFTVIFFLNKIQKYLLFNLIHRRNRKNIMAFMIYGFVICILSLLLFAVRNRGPQLTRTFLEHRHFKLEKNPLPEENDWAGSICKVVFYTSENHTKNG